MNKEIYKMKLHETLKIKENISAYRVPGGWIYFIADYGEVRSHFVPFYTESEDAL